MADVGKLVNVIDNDRCARSKGGALLLVAQGLLAHLLQQSGQSIPSFLPGVAHHFQLGGNVFDLGDAPERILVPGARLNIDLDHDQGCDDGKDGQKQCGRDADPVLFLGSFAQIFLRLPQFVAHLCALRLPFIAARFEGCGAGPSPAGVTACATTMGS